MKDNIFALLAVILTVMTAAYMCEPEKFDKAEEVEVTEQRTVSTPYYRPDIDILLDVQDQADIKEVYIEMVAAESTEEEPANQPFTDEEIELISHLVIAEAEGQPEEGQRYVVDVVLNRVMDPIWPDTVRDVIYSPGQFSCIWDGRWDRTSSTPETTWLVIDEILRQQNNEIVYFRTGHYGCGDPVFVCGDHYFSK